MKFIKIAILALFAAAYAAPTFASCTHDSDRAADGSRCGKRSSDSRPGGK